VRQARYYRETADDETAARFLDAAEATLERLAAMPHMGLVPGSLQRPAYGAFASLPCMDLAVTSFSIGP